MKSGIGRSIAVACFVTACGYRPLTAHHSRSLHVALSAASGGRAELAEALLQGASDALQREGALAAGAGYPRLEVELVRVDDVPLAISVESAAPRARAEEVSVIARGAVVEQEGGRPDDDTGDVRGESQAGSPGLRAMAAAMRDAERAAAYQAGRRIGLRILGHPVATAD